MYIKINHFLKGDQGICYEIVSPRNVRNYTNKISPIRLAKHELNTNDSNKRAKGDREKLMRLQPYTEREGETHIKKKKTAGN